MEQPIVVLFLCTGNSARSILAEQLLNHRGNGRFRAFSAGSNPRGAVHPGALDLLRRKRLPTDGLRSKGWEEFSTPGTPHLDFIITVCDRAASETCPVWAGNPATAHWSIEDPASEQGSGEEQRLAFERAYHALDKRIRDFVRTGSPKAGE